MSVQIAGFKVIETIYRSGRGDYLGHMCEQPPKPGGTTTTPPPLVFVKTNNPGMSTNTGHSLAHEVNVHRALTGAPGVVPLLGAWFDKDAPSRWCIATEYSPHGDLQSLVRRHGPLGERDARLVVWQLLQGLEAIHRRGYGHFDIKPLNWLIRENLPSGIFGTIIDFGFAYPLRPLVGKTSSKGRGTPGYTAPEISNGLTLTLPDRADIYSAGCFLFFILTGKYAYEPSATHFRLHSFNEINRVCSAQALNFLCTLLHQDPLARPTAAQALMHPWFALLLEEHDIVARSYPPAPRPMLIVTKTVDAMAAPPNIVAAEPANAVAEAPVEPVDAPEAEAEWETPGEASEPPSHEAEETADADDNAMTTEKEEDYVDEPSLPAKNNKGKRRRRVGTRRELYKNQFRRQITMAKMLRARRQKQSERQMATKDTGTVQDV
ncbi:kinase-like protein [Peniophora sp. CONT]|nr:kinase-like protein [Peniophora sp. CONT]